MNIPGIDVLIHLPGEPRGKGRPRAFVARGRIVMHTDSATLAYEKLMAGAARNGMGNRGPIQGPIDLTIEAHFRIPPSWPKYRRAAALAGTEPHTSRPDADNVVKIVLDALNGIVWRDDAQVVRITASKHYSAAPGVMVAVKEMRAAEQVAA